MKRFDGICVVATALLICVGCGQKESASTTPPTMTADDAATEVAAVDDDSSESSEATTGSSERKAFDGLEFMIPSGWEQVTLSQFQKGIVSAKFTMPKAGADVILTLSRSGGGLDANLDRWRGQVAASRPEVTETLTVAGTESSLIDMEGRFSGGFGKEPQDGWRMIGVIVPLSDQGYFMKLTGPVDQVATVEKDFRAFVKSAITD